MAIIAIEAMNTKMMADEAYKDVVSKYKDALARAESALP
jgi:hypothetical protein